jgi:peptidoglycan biosynthesis protein MviN/MurJ (putative lipid II flippase)
MRRLAGMHANHRSIIASALLIGGLTFAAKLFVAGREVAIAWRYGVSATVDAYQLALTIVSWVPMMVTGVVTVVLVPRLVALRNQPFDRSRLIGEINGTLLCVSIVVMILSWIAAPLASHLLASNSRAETVDLTTAMCRIMSPVACMLIWTGFLSARLQARRRFAYTATEALPAVIVAAAVLAPMNATPQFRLSLATSVGFALQLLMLVAMVVSSDGPFGSFDFRHRAPQWRSLYRDLGVMALGQAVLTLTIPIDQAFAARLGPGAVAALGYAGRIVILATGLGAVVFTRAFLPVFSSAVAQGDDETGVRQARQWAHLLLIAGLLMVGAAWITAPWLVSAIFERGAFTPSDAALVAEVLRFGALQLPFVFAGLAVVQWLAAKGLYSSLLWIACGALALKLVLNLLLVGRFGLVGLMSATAAMYAFSFACQYLVAVKR